MPMAFVDGLLVTPENLPDWAAAIGWAYRRDQTRRYT